MRIISRKPLRDLAERCPDAKEQLDAWWAEVQRAKWRTPGDIKDQYGSASILKAGRVVFNICGNKYRLIVKFDMRAELGFVRFAGTHEEYNKVNAEEV